jgi:3-hydroxyisobutyrate dehydrogenase-like beta-hydroxyacid dehydrogenase
MPNKTVAVIGLGIMGGAIARNLIAHGFAVGGFDIDEARRMALAEAGAAVAGSAAEAARGADVVLSSLPSAAALAATVESLVSEPRRGLIVAELSTLPIADKEAARARLAEAGITLLDCPLSGTGAQARTGDLALFGSGEEAAFRECGEVFAGFTRVAHYLGAFGNGSRMKFVANLLVAVHNVATAEALVLGRRAGLDPATVARVIASGAGSSRIFELRSPMMVEGVYAPPTATIEMFQKDIAIIAAFARELGVETPVFSASAPVYAAAQRQGRGAEDGAAVHAVLEEWSRAGR